MSERKAVIKNADMSEDMQNDAVDCATQALEMYHIEKDSLPKKCQINMLSSCRSLTFAKPQKLPLQRKLCLKSYPVAKTVHTYRAVKVLAYKEKDTKTNGAQNGEPVKEKVVVEVKGEVVTEEKPQEAITEEKPQEAIVEEKREEKEVVPSEVVSVEKVPSKEEQQTEKVVSELKEVGFDQEQARQVLQKWEESGAENPEQLRKLFIKGSYIPFLAIGFQILLDTGAAYGGLAAALSLSTIKFFGATILEILFYFLGIYFAIGVFFDLFTLGALIAGAVNFGTNTGAFYSAVKQIAGDTGLNVLDKAKQSVNIVRVTQALNSMSQILKTKKMETGEFSTLENLGAYLTLIKAKENLGFKSEDYNVTDEQAGEIAVVFAKYDVNEDYKLELTELKNLISDLGKELTEDELAAAIEILDKRKSGFVEFDEFVNWWVNEIQVEEKIAPTEAAKKSETSESD
eukprot:TRINITY_DN7577_c1_g1_i1.p1 TRINITY_DN7577_c1_g1~~TRINITY_DN7577_c1_g1_i1.p1  ORF type:complete len:458 (+),score=106.59 TRINITY_DN7577_c1_g1_i1:238-1611(+)